MATKKKKTLGKNKKKTSDSTSTPLVTSVSTQTNKSINASGLNKWNIVLALLFAIQAVIIVIISKSASLPVVSHFLTTDTLASHAAGHTVLAPAVRHLFDLNLRYLVASFLLVSAIIHGLIATYKRKRYESSLTRHVNGLRWFDYGLSAGIMLVTIALINGVYDLASLIMIFVLVALLHVLGFWGESKATTMQAKLQSFVALCAVGATVWLVVLMYVKDAIVYGTGLAHFVYWIDGAIFVLTLGLAANTLMVFRSKGKWANYLYGEQLFMILSFIAKSVLAWLIFAAFLK